MKSNSFRRFYRFFTHTSLPLHSTRILSSPHHLQSPARPTSRCRPPPPRSLSCSRPADLAAKRARHRQARVVVQMGHASEKEKTAHQTNQRNIFPKSVCIFLTMHKKIGSSISAVLASVCQQQFENYWFNSLFLFYSFFSFSASDNAITEVRERMAVQ